MDASTSTSGGLSSARLGALLLAAAASGALATWAALRLPRGGAAPPAGRAACEVEKGGLVGDGERGARTARGLDGGAGPGAVAPRGNDAPAGLEAIPSRLGRRPTGGTDALGSRMSSIDLGHVGPWSGYGTDGEVDARLANGEAGSGRTVPLASAAGSGRAPLLPSASGSGRGTLLPSASGSGRSALLPPAAGSSAAPARQPPSSCPRRGLSSASTDPACVPFWWPSPSPPREDPLDPRPRERYLSWDDYFMSIAFLSAQRSKDPNKQVGAVVVDRKHVIAGIGYNGFPRGCSDHALPWRKIEPTDGSDDLGTKYLYVVHAETNAILNANRAGLEGSSIYVTLFPCNECAKLLIQVGIREVVYHEGKGEGGRRGGLIPRVDSAGGGGQGGYDGTEASVFGLRDDDEEVADGDDEEDGTIPGRPEDSGEALAGRASSALQARAGRAPSVEGARVGRAPSAEGARVGRAPSVEGARVGRAPSAEGEGRLYEPNADGGAAFRGPNGTATGSVPTIADPRLQPAAAPPPRPSSRDSPDRRRSPFAEPSGGFRPIDAADEDTSSSLSTSTSSSSSDESARVAGGEPVARDASGPSPPSSALPPPSSRPDSSSGPRRRISLHASSNPFSADFDRAASGASLQPSGTPIPSRVASYVALGTAPLLGPSHPSSSSPTAPDLDGEEGEEKEEAEQEDDGGAGPSGQRSTPVASPPRPIPATGVPAALRGALTASPLRSPSRPDGPRARFSPSGSLYASPSVFLAPERRATAELRGEAATSRGARGEPEESASGAASPRLAPVSTWRDPAPSSPFLARVPSSPMLTHRTLRAAKKAKAARDAQYRASRRMLAMAGVAVRQHKFEHEA